MTKQIRLNLFFNILSFIVTIAFGLFFTPYLVKKLGIIAYGIVPLAMIFNQYINVITGALTNSLSRFYTVSIQKQNITKAKEYISSSFYVLGGIIIVITPFIVIFISNIHLVFNIPTNFIKDTKVLFSFSIIGFIISLFSSLFNITLYAQNRLDYLNVIKICRVSLRVLITVLFFEKIQYNIVYIGYAIFITEGIALLISLYFFSLTNIKKISVSIKHFKKYALSSVLGMTVWVIIHQLGDVALNKTDIIILNLFWSTRESGILGALSIIGPYILISVSVISSLFGPLILIAYSKGDHAKVKSIALRNCMIIGIITSFIVGIICGFSEEIIAIWLGAEFAEYKYWLIVKIIIIPFYAASGVLSFVYRSWNKVKHPALITLLIGIINVLVAYTIIYLGDFKETWILYMLAATNVFVFIQSFLLNAVFFYKIYPETNISSILIIFFKILFALAITFATSSVYNYFFTTNTLINLVFSFLAVSITSAFLILTLVTSREEKKYLKSLILNMRNKIIS